MTGNATLEEAPQASEQRAARASDGDGVLEYLETHVTDHCNLNCKGCGHFSPISPHRFADPDDLDRDLELVARTFDGVERFHLLGGEPLLHPAVTDLARIAAEHLPSTERSLVTNGLLLARQPASFWRTMAQTATIVRVTAYPVRVDMDTVHACAAEAGADVRVTSPKGRFWRVPLRPQGDRDPERSFEACRTLFACPFLADGRIYPCPTAALAPIVEHASGTRLEATEADFVDLHHEPDAAEAVERLNRPVPWCRFCDFDSLEWTDWAVSSRSSSEWF